ncbi:MAG TPA: anhydro-N-acetylmuramic acid kinase [Candidatus Tumulicola sp.]
MRAIGLISGTSLDGIDAALVELVPRANGYAVELVRFATVPYPSALHAQLRAALPPQTVDVATLASLHRETGIAFAQAAASVAQGRIDFVASHGQTIWHDGDRRLTMQIGDPYVLRDRIGASVCFDFRTADCVAGGHGAPLMPHVDALLFSDPSEDRVAINIGGIANLTALPRGAAPSHAYDTGPGNMLLDAFVRSRTNGVATMDRDGALAAQGNVDAGLLEAALTDAYFAQPAPKSTGRERFGEHFLTLHEQRLRQLSDADAAATLSELTARTIADAIAATGFAAPRAIVSGGGAYNPDLLQRLQRNAPHALVETSDEYGVPADAKEAIAFAILGYETLRGRPANVPAATGAKSATVLGAIVPHDLCGVLARLEAECRSM